jgi:hypothetical protein
LTLALAPVGPLARAQEVVVSDVFMTPLLEWDATPGATYRVETAPSPTGAWVEVASWFASTGGPHRWADPQPRGDARRFYRVVRTPPSSKEAFLTAFEDDEGWGDHGEPAWTNATSSGTWVGCGAVAASTPDRAHSPVRFISLGAAKSFLELPAKDNVYRLLYWGRASSTWADWTVWVQEHDGARWNTFDAVRTTNTVHTQFAHCPVPAFPNPGQRLRFYMEEAREGALYLDDLVVETLTARHVITNQVIAVSDGSAVLAGRLPSSPVFPASVVVRVASFVLTDSGDGILSGNFGATGRIDYRYGYWSLGFALGIPDVGEPVLASYEHLELDTPLRVVLEKNLAVADGLRTVYAGTLSETPLLAGALAIRAGTVFLQDDGQGGLRINPAGVTGTVDYETGAWSLDFNGAPPFPGLPIRASYTWWPSGQHAGAP